MNKIPISIIFMTSTKGHFGFREIYKDTLNDLNKQIPLTDFSVKVAHIKVSPGDTEIAKSMVEELEKRGFLVLTTEAAWTRGISHQNEYMRDLIKVSREESLYKNSYVLWLEDDSTMLCHKEKLPTVLHRMTSLLECSSNTLTARFLRKDDLSTSPMVESPVKNEIFFFSPHFNFQPSIMRSRDFFLACKIMEDNFDKTVGIQCEALWRYLLAHFSRTDLKHIVLYPEYAETIHLGVADYENVKKQLK